MSQEWIDGSSVIIGRGTKERGGRGFSGGGTGGRYFHQQHFQILIQIFVSFKIDFLFQIEFDREKFGADEGAIISSIQITRFNHPFLN